MRKEKGGGASNWRESETEREQACIDLLIDASCRCRCLCNATFNQCKYSRSVWLLKFACVNSFIITFACRPDGYGQMQHPSADVLLRISSILNIFIKRMSVRIVRRSLRISGSLRTLSSAESTSNSS